MMKATGNYIFTYDIVGKLESSNNRVLPCKLPPKSWKQNCKESRIIWLIAALQFIF